MNKKKIILGSCGLLACLVGGSIFAINHLVDRKMILDQLYSNIEKQTGRKLALQNLDIYLFPWPEIQASKITLSNMPGGKNPNFITAGHLKADLNLWSLWQKKIHFKSVQLSHVQIHLERNEQGQKNWDLQPVEAAKTNITQPVISKSNHRKWQWQFNNFQLNDVECWYEDDFSHTNTYLLFKQAELNQLETNKVKFNITGTHHHADFTISGRVSSFDELLENNDNVIHPIKFQINLAEYLRKQNIGNLRISGTLTSFTKAKGYDIIVRGTILNLKDLNQLFPHANLPSIENITLNTAIKDISTVSDLQSKPQISLLQIHTGKIDAKFLPSDLQLINTEVIANDLNSDVNTQVIGKISGKMFRWSGHLGQLKFLQDVLLSQTDKSLPISGNLSSEAYNLQLDGTLGGKNPSLAIKFNLLDYNKFYQGLGDLNAQDITYTGKIFTPFPLTVAFFKNVNKEDLFRIVTVGKLKSNHIKINQVSFDNFSSGVEWKDQKLSLTQLLLSNKQNTIKGDVFYSVKEIPATLEVKINNSYFPMKWIEDYFKISNVYSGQMMAMGVFYTKGNNWQEWEHNLTGKLGLSGVDGKLEAEGLKHYIGQAAATLPLKKSLSAECLAIRTQINQNNLYFDTLTLQTNQFALNGHGTFNIADQMLDLHFIPDIRLGVISASAPLRIGGTLSKPYTTFDKNKNKVFSLNINALSKNIAPTNYCATALDNAKNPQGISQK